MAVISVLYEIKFWGWNPANWRGWTQEGFPTGRNMPMKATPVKRRGRIEWADPANLLRWDNLKELGKWIWAWLK
jgi:yeast amino acid transporter